MLMHSGGVRRSRQRGRRARRHGPGCPENAKGTRVWGIPHHRGFSIRAPGQLREAKHAHRPPSEPAKVRLVCSDVIFACFFIHSNRPGIMVVAQATSVVARLSEVTREYSQRSIIGRGRNLPRRSSSLDPRSSTPPIYQPSHPM